MTEQSASTAAIIKLGILPNIARNTYAIAISLRGRRPSRRSKEWYLEESAQLSLLTIFSSPLMQPIRNFLLWQFILLQLTSLCSKHQNGEPSSRRSNSSLLYVINSRAISSKPRTKMSKSKSFKSYQKLAIFKSLPMDLRIYQNNGLRISLFSLMGSHIIGKARRLAQRKQELTSQSKTLKKL